MHVPRPLKEQALHLCKEVDELHQCLGRSPTVGELAEHLGIAEEAVLEAFGVAHSRLAISLDHPASLDGDQNLGDLSRLLRRALGRMRTQLVEP